MSYVLALVDEGLLGLTRFKTPDPYGYFNATEALGVRTWDMFDYVIGAYGGRIEQMFAIGGDAEQPNTGALKAQRRRPSYGSSTHRNWAPGRRTRTKSRFRPTSARFG